MLICITNLLLSKSLKCFLHLFPLLISPVQSCNTFVILYTTLYFPWIGKYSYVFTFIILCRYVIISFLLHTFFTFSCRLILSFYFFLRVIQHVLPYYLSPFSCFPAIFIVPVFAFFLLMLSLGILILPPSLLLLCITSRYCRTFVYLVSFLPFPPQTAVQINSPSISSG